MYWGGFRCKGNVMILFPSRDEAIVSKMSPDEICEALSAVTIPRKEYRFWKKKPEFVGEVNTAGFKVTHPEKCIIFNYLPCRS